MSSRSWLRFVDAVTRVPLFAIGMFPIRFEQALGCLGKLHEINAFELASLVRGSWNQIVARLARVDSLRQAA